MEEKRETMGGLGPVLAVAAVALATGIVIGGYFFYRHIERSREIKRAFLEARARVEDFRQRSEAFERNVEKERLLAASEERKPSRESVMKIIAAERDVLKSLAEATVSMTRILALDPGHAEAQSSLANLRVAGAKYARLRVSEDMRLDEERPFDEGIMPDPPPPPLPK